MSDTAKFYEMTLSGPRFDLAISALKQQRIAMKEAIDLMMGAGASATDPEVASLCEKEFELETTILILQDTAKEI